VDQLMSDERTHSVNGNIATDEVLWALTDRQGSVNDLAKLDTSGVTSVVDHIVRDSFGNVISESDPSQGCLIGWTGRPRDGVTGLQNNLNRWYDSHIAGWLSQDPKGFESGTTNLYCYCGNSPTNYVDPSGLDRYIVQRLGHLFLVVDVWDPTTKRMVKKELDFDITGYSVKDYVATALDKVLKTIPSTRLQDMCLYEKWEDLSQWWWMGYSPLLTNCWFATWYWQYYGGAGGKVENLPPVPLLDPNLGTHRP
jgi:RHS repeat-associated protein